MTRMHSLVPYLPAFMIATSIGLPIASAQTSQDFETGAETDDVPDWDELGPNGVADSSHGVTAAGGEYFAFLANELLCSDLPFLGTDVAVSTAAMESALGIAAGTLSTLQDDAIFAGGGFGGSGYNDPVSGSVIYREFDVVAGDTLTFDWNFLYLGNTTPSSTPFVGNGVDGDFAFVSLDVDGVQELADWLTIDETVFTNLIGFDVFSCILGFYSSSGSSGWEPFSHEFANSGTVRLGIGVTQSVVTGFGSTSELSGIAIDNFHISAGPGGGSNQPPTAAVDTSGIEGACLENPDGTWIVTEGQALSIPFTGSDADGDALLATATGLPAGAELVNPSGPQPLVSSVQWTPSAAEAAGAPYTIEVTFTDPDGASASASLTIAAVNLNPTCAIAGVDSEGVIVVECASPTGTPVSLSATVDDPDGAVADLDLVWEVSNFSVILADGSTAAPSGTFPMGDTMVTLTVTDGCGGFDICDAVVRVQDTLPPEIGMTSDCAALWPPNHKLVAVELFVPVSDACTDPSSIQISTLTVRSDEEDDAAGGGDGTTTGDVNGFDGNAAPVEVAPTMVYDAALQAFVGTVMLRAERAGAGNGRAYTIDVSAVDSSDNTAQASCVIVVPHSRAGGAH